MQLTFSKEQAYLGDEFTPLRDVDLANLAAALVGFAPRLKTDKILTCDRGSPVLARNRSIAARACRIAEYYRKDRGFDTWIDQLCVGMRPVGSLVPKQAG